MYQLLGFPLALMLIQIIVTWFFIYLWVLTMAGGKVQTIQAPRKHDL